MIVSRVGCKVLARFLHDLEVAKKQPIGVAMIGDLATFNSPQNLRGETHRVIILDEEQCSEGISLFAVRRVFMASAPRSCGQFVQQCGRAVRMHSHKGLPEDECDVSFKIYLASLAVGQTEDQLAFARLCRGSKKTAVALREFRAGASSTNPAEDSVESVLARIRANQIRVRENASREKVVVESVLPQIPTMAGEDGTDGAPTLDRPPPSSEGRDETADPTPANKIRRTRPKNVTDKFDDLKQAFSLASPELAEAIMTGHKDIENRDVQMSGWYAMHVSKKPRDEKMTDVLKHYIPDLPTPAGAMQGHVVGVVFVERSVRFAALRAECGCGDQCDPTPGGVHAGGRLYFVFLVRTGRRRLQSENLGEPPDPEAPPPQILQELATPMGGPAPTDFAGTCKIRGRPRPHRFCRNLQNP